MSAKFPPFVLSAVYHHNAWVVGSAADPGQLHPRDIDILVPHQDWLAIAVHIPKNATPNSFGGWSFEEDGFKIDVWPGDLCWYLGNNLAKWVWQPRIGCRWYKI